MLKISKLADYASVTMHWLSSHSDVRFSAAAIAEQTNIAAPTVSKILKLLNDAELLSSTRGVQGGYQLSRPAAQISLVDIISAIDGQPAVTECSKTDACCQYDHHCELRGNWQYINQMIYDLLSQVTLDDMGRSLSESQAIPLRFHPLSSQKTEQIHE